MPWQKGVSGNPGGGKRKVVPSTGMTLREMAREHTDKALNALLDALEDEEAGHPVKIQAATALLDRGWGKPTQPVSGDDDMPPVDMRVDLSSLPDEVLRQVAKVAM
jgi:hypothetical protein